MADNLTIKNSDKFREEITKRNIYTIDNQYPVTSEDTIDKIVESVSNITSMILPFKANSISDSLLGRSITDKSPLTEIGLACLAKQLAYTTKDNLLSDYTPRVNVGRLLGDEGKFISWTDYRITKKTSSDKKSTALNFLKEAVGFQSMRKNDLAFDVNGGNKKIYTNYDIIDYTGKFTLDTLTTQVKRNDYINDVLAKKLNLSATQYSEYGLDSKINNSDTAVIDNLNTKDSTQNFINSNLENNTNITNDFIWGIDNNKVNANTGLLAYTKKIINNGLTNYHNISSNGKYFVDKDGNFSNNGSAIYKAGESSLTPNAEGLRQHSFKDPYGRFAKAIRFNGNGVYNGSKNSVIYSSVIPRIHPVFNNNNNRNLMFSIENLADTINEVTTKSGVCGEDVEGKLVPYSEIGQNGGRLMWFPPYDISFNETTANKIDETMMVGRGEPIYTYMNSSRTGTLSFKLIIDYPQQLKTMLKKKGGNLTQEEISNFFLYGIQLDLNKKLNVVKQNEIKNKNLFEIQQRSTFFDKLDNLPNQSIKVLKRNLESLTTASDINNFLSIFYVNEVNRKYFDISIDSSHISPNTSSPTTVNPNDPDYTIILKEIIDAEYYDITSEEYDKDYLNIEVPVEKDNVTLFNEQIYGYGYDDYFMINVYRNDVSNKNVIYSDEDKKTLTILNTIPENQIETNDFESNLNELISFDDGNSSLIDNTFKPAFHSQTPEEFHRRLTFLQQCMRQGGGLNLVDNPKNSVFGKQPFSIIRLGDHIYSKVIFSNLTIDYDAKDMIWDLNPEGWGMQPMTANITLQMFIIGGQSLEAPIEALQNAISYNYYANSTFGERGYFNNGQPIIKNNTGK